MRNITTLAILALLASPGLALADESISAAPTLDLGSIGELAESSAEDRYSFSDHFGLRLGGQAFSLDLDPNYTSPGHSPGSTFDAPDAMVDFYPFRGNFRLSGGFLYDGDDLDNPAGGPNDITIGGLPFTPSQANRNPSTLDFSSYTPYAGLGVQSSFWSGRLEFALDFGLQYQGNSGAEAGADGSSSSAAAAAGERDSDEADDQLDLLGFSPRAGLSVKLRF